MTTIIVLFAIACILVVGFAFIISVLIEIRDHVEDSCEYVRRVADEIANDELPTADEWTLVASNPPFGANYSSGKTKPPPKADA